MKTLPILCAAVLPAQCLAASTCKDQFSSSCYSAGSIIDRDVAIIGGGSSGTFAAITLKDKGKSIVVVEKEANLGGHVRTYVDPATGNTIEAGVRVFENTTLADNFFKRLNAPMGPFIPTGPPLTYTDFVTAETLTGYTPSRNFSAYIAQLDKYPYLIAGNGLKLPKPVPSDLALSFADFVKKYNLQDIAYSIWVNPALGDVGDVLKIPALYVLKGLTKIVLTQEGIPGGTLASAVGKNQLAWWNAQTELGSNVLLSSTVLATKRPSKGSTTKTLLVVNTPSGPKLIRAGKVLFTAAQSLKNLEPLLLDSTEKAVFSQLSYTGFYSGLVENTGLPDTISYQNADKGTTNWHIPKSPSTMRFFTSSVPGVHSFWYQSPAPISDDKVKADVISAVGRLTNSAAKGVTFLRYDNNNPGILYATPEKILAGFWDQMNALQGYRNTYYTGLLFEPSSPGLWQFTKDLIQTMYP